MTDNEIIKALECLNGGLMLCKNCAYNHCKFPQCKKDIAKDAVDLINRQQAEYEDLQEQFRHLDIECERLEKENESQQAEIERLKSPVLAINNFDLSDEEFKEKIKNMPIQIIVYNEEQIKSEAVKEYKSKVENDVVTLLGKSNCTEFINCLEYRYKEMVGE